jgi:hypothetical protein
MKTENRIQMKYVFWAVLIVVLAFAVYEIVKVIRAGERTLAGILQAPFNAVGSVWSAIKGLFTSGSTSAATPDLPISGLTPSQSIFATPGDTSSNQATLLSNGNFFDATDFRNQFPGFYT